MCEVARWVSHAAWWYDGARRLSKINYQEEDLRERKREREREAEGGRVVIPRAFVRARSCTGNSGDQGTERLWYRREKLNEDEEDTEEAASYANETHEARGGGGNGEDTDRPRRGNLRWPLLEGRKGGRASFGTGPSSRSLLAAARWSQQARVFSAFVLPKLRTSNERYLKSEIRAARQKSIHVSDFMSKIRHVTVTKLRSSGLIFSMQLNKYSYILLWRN